jgi:hypothetical protein
MLIIKETPRDVEKEYQELLIKLKENPDMEMETDEVFLHRIRVGIANGDIDNESVKVVHTDGTTCNVGKDGRLDRWPLGMFDKFYQYLDQLLMLSWEKEKKDDGPT